MQSQLLERSHWFVPQLHKSIVVDTCSHLRKPTYCAPGHHDPTVPPVVEAVHNASHRGYQPHQHGSKPIVVHTQDHLLPPTHLVSLPGKKANALGVEALCNGIQHQLSDNRDNKAGAQTPIAGLLLPKELLLDNRGKRARAQTPVAGLMLVEELAEGKSEWDISRHSPELLETLCCGLNSTSHTYLPEKSRKQLSSNWKWWLKWCQYADASPYRIDSKAHLGLDPTGQRRGAFMQAATIPWILDKMKPRGRPWPLPESAWKFIVGIRKWHEMEGFPMISTRRIKMVVDALVEKCVAEHGPEWLEPQRKSPFPTTLLANLFGVCSPTGTRIGRLTVDASEWIWVCLATLIAVMSQTGFRKDEVSVRVFTKRSLTRSNLLWLIDDAIIRSPTVEQLLPLTHGRDYAVLKPSPAKADRSEARYGTLPIYLPYRTDQTINAARQLMQLELKWMVKGTKRREVPLFAILQRKPLTASFLDIVLKNLLTHLVGPTQTKSYSWHSFRWTLACSLLCAGYSGPLIQALCRWQSEESPREYALLGHKAYGDMLNAANGVDTSHVNLARLPELEDDVIVAGLAQLQLNE